MRELCCGSLEYAGSIEGYNITVTTGEPDRAPADLGASFTWHYHPGGEARLSADDCLCFLISAAQHTLLLTDERALLFAKTAQCAELCERLREICQRNSAQRELLMVRLSRELNRAIGDEPESVESAELARRLGLELEKW